MSWLEIIAVVLNFIFLFCLIKEKRVGWLFGIAGSFLSIFLFYQVRLYAEAMIYFYYTIIGIYGWYAWGNLEKKQKGVRYGSWQTNLIGVLISCVGALTLGYFLNKIKSEYPYWDAFSSAFALFASYLEARKLLETWYYWILINLGSIFLYYAKDLKLYAGLMVLYFVTSIVGLVSWRRLYKESIAGI